MREKTAAGAPAKNPSQISRTARGVVGNWAAMALGLLIAFFLSPFVVHKLGNTAYGIWILVVSATTYLGLLDLGFRTAVTRFVSRAHAIEDDVAAAAAVSAALWLRLWIGVAIVTIAVAIAALMNRLFDLPPSLRTAAMGAMVITGINAAQSLYFGVFGGVLAALNRFDLLSGAAMVQGATRAVLVLLVLSSGYGLVALAVLELLVSLFCNLLLRFACFRIYRTLKVSLARPAPAILRDLWSYSSSVMLINISGTIIYYTDNLVVGAFVSVAAVTFFAIGASLSEYVRQIVVSLTSTFAPLVSSLEARGEQEKLRLLLIQGTRAALLVGLPFILVLFFRGQTFIGLWMGPEYATISGGVLQILLICRIFIVANSTGGNIAYGLSKHGQFALWLGCEAAANLLLSILLVERFGVYGVAIGTLVPDLFVNLVLCPRYICRIVGLPQREFLLEGWLRPGLAALPFAAACYLTDRYWSASGLIAFFLQIAAILPAYFVGVAVAFRREVVSIAKGRPMSLDSLLALPRRQQASWGRDG